MRSNLVPPSCFKVIQDVVSLILFYRTMSLFRATSSKTFIMSDVQVNLHYIIKFGTDTWRSNFEQQTDSVLFLLVNPMDKHHKDPDTIGLSVLRHAQYMHKAWKRHQDAVYWVDINLAMRK